MEVEYKVETKPSYTKVSSRSGAGREKPQIWLRKRLRPQVWGGSCRDQEQSNTLKL